MATFTLHDRWRTSRSVRTQSEWTPGKQQRDTWCGAAAHPHLPHTFTDAGAVLPEEPSEHWPSTWVQPEPPVPLTTTFCTPTSSVPAWVVSHALHWGQTEQLHSVLEDLSGGHVQRHSCLLELGLTANNLKMIIA